VARRSASAQPEIRQVQNRLAGNPEDLATAIELAQLAIRDGRTNADPRRYGQAQAALAPWWTIREAPLEVRLLRAIILQSLHDFPGATGDLDAILTHDPDNAQARLSRAFIRQTIGDLTGAIDDCRKLPHSIGLTARAACDLRAQALSGAALESLPRLIRAMAFDIDAEAQTRRWAEAICADMALMAGDNQLAEQHFKTAIKDESDILTLVAYADYLLDNGRPQEVLTLLADRSEADIVYLRLAIAGKELGDPRTPLWTGLLTERFDAARAGGVQLHLREEARFELEVKGNAATALQLALADWKVQKEPADTRLVLEAALAAHDVKAADETLGFIAKTGLADARLKPLVERIEGERT
jgi:tetratricopeptide (TPR) repeat protein